MAQYCRIAGLSGHYRINVVTKTVPQGHLGGFIPDGISYADAAYLKYADGIKNDILELGKVSSSLIEDDDEEVGGCGRFPWAL